MSLQTVYDESDLKKSTKAPKEYLRSWQERQWEEAKRYVSAQTEGKLHLVSQKVDLHKKCPDTLKMKVSKVERKVLYFDR
jgi:hypothetical protein